MANYMQVLLLEDVEGHGRMGDVIKARRGFVRNYLVPHSKACHVTTATLRRRTQLAAMREEKAKADLAESERLAGLLSGRLFQVTMRVDEMGHLYGSVSIADILKLLEDAGFNLEKKNVALAHAIKSVGLYQVTLNLKEGVTCHFDLEVRGDREVIPEELMAHPEDSEEV